MTGSILEIGARSYHFVAQNEGVSMLNPWPLALLVVAVPAAASSSAPPAKEKAANPQDKVICKSFADTGSLVSTHRECKPKREWDRERELIRETGPAINSCRSSGAGLPC